MQNSPRFQCSHQTAYKYGGEWVDELLQYLEKNIEFTMGYLQKNLPCVTAVRPEATYMIWLDFKRDGPIDGRDQ